MRLRVICISLALLILASCAGQRTSEDRGFENFRTGSQGLVFQFMPNLPPARLYDDQDFNVQLRVTNAGAANAGSASDRMYLSGFDPSILTGISSFGEQVPPLEGKTQFNIQGTYGFVNFKGIPRALSVKKIDKYPFTLVATGCYNYQTIAQGNVCIDPDPFSTTAKQKACIPQTTSMGGSQGGPIGVSSVLVEATPGRTRFRIDVSNAGGGIVYRFGPEFSQKCSPYDQRGLQFNEIDMVRLDRVEVAGTNILPSCKPLDQGHVRLINGRGSLVCEYTAPRSQAAFVTPLLVEMSYGYQQILQQQVEIVSSR
ncbi:hypothetical protein HY641_02530 [Candidatus Woesearchaeota archaeon]|nr:hypothetical protein [Candidatus Woesearchaeota archaeon]